MIKQIKITFILNISKTETKICTRFTFTKKKNKHITNKNDFCFFLILYVKNNNMMHVPNENTLKVIITYASNYS